MTDTAIRNGVYLQPLTKKETVAVMAIVLSEHYAQQNQWRKSIDVSNLILKYYPKYAYAMIKIGNAYSQLLQEKIKIARTIGYLSSAEKESADHLYSQNLMWFAKAERIGWQPPSSASEIQYLESIKKRTQLSETLTPKGK